MRWVACRPLRSCTPSKQCSGAARFSQLLAEGKETTMAAAVAATRAADDGGRDKAWNAAK